MLSCLWNRVFYERLKQIVFFGEVLDHLLVYCPPLLALLQKYFFNVFWQI